MKNRLEEQMNRVLDTASLKDILPDFEQDALWETVAQQLTEQPKARRVLPLGFKGISYAAAVLLAVILTYGVLHFTGRKEQPAVAIKPTSSLPVTTSPAKKIAPIKETLPASQPAEHIAQTTKQQPTVHQAITAPSAPALQVAQQQIILPEKTATPAPANQPNPKTVVKASPRKVIHYLDVDEEASNNSSTEDVAGPSFIQMKLNKPGYHEDMTARPLLKEFVFALGK